MSRAVFRGHKAGTQSGMSIHHQWAREGKARPRSTNPSTCGRCLHCPFGSGSRPNFEDHRREHLAGQIYPRMAPVAHQHSLLQRRRPENASPTTAATVGPQGARSAFSGGRCRCPATFTMQVGVIPARIRPAARRNLAPRSGIARSASRVLAGTWRYRFVSRHSRLKSCSVNVCTGRRADNNCN